jgi:hypothetical protein
VGMPHATRRDVGAQGVFIANVALLGWLLLYNVGNMFAGALLAADVRRRVRGGAGHRTVRAVPGAAATAAHARRPCACHLSRCAGSLTHSRRAGAGCTRG